MQTKLYNKTGGCQKVNVHLYEADAIILSNTDVYGIVWLEHYGDLTINFEHYSLKGHYLIFLCPDEILEVEDVVKCTVVTIPIDFEIVERKNFVQTFGSLEKCIHLDTIAFLKITILYRRLQQASFQESLTVVEILSGILDVCLPKLMKGLDEEEIILGYSFICLVHKYYKMHHEMSFYANKLITRPKCITQKFHELGILPPHEFIKKRILIEAKRQLLYTNKTIRTICFDVGFNDPAYFSRFFKKNTGVTAKIFKERNVMTCKKKRKMSNDSG